jgi:hypothetical protein
MVIRVMSSSLFSWPRLRQRPWRNRVFPTGSVPLLGMQRVKIFFSVHVEGDFYGLIQFLDFASIARAH